MKLDGTETPKPTPFDAHEQVVRGHHTHSAEKGYEAAEYEPAEYPKHVDHVDGQPITVNSAEEEEAYKASKKKNSKAGKKNEAAE